MARIEHSPDDLVIYAEVIGKRDPSHMARTESQRQRGFSGHFRRDGDGSLARQEWAWVGYRLAVIYPPRNCFFQGVLGLRLSVGLVYP